MDLKAKKELYDTDLKFNKRGTLDLLQTLSDRIDLAYRAAVVLAEFYEKNGNRSFKRYDLEEVVEKELKVSSFDAEEALDDLERHFIVIEEEFADN